MNLMVNLLQLLFSLLLLLLLSLLSIILSLLLEFILLLSPHYLKTVMGDIVNASVRPSVLSCYLFLNH